MCSANVKKVIIVEETKGDNMNELVRCLIFYSLFCCLRIVDIDLYNIKH